MHLKAADRVYWLRIGLGSAAGVVAGYFSALRGAPFTTGFLLALAFYTASFYLARYVVATDLPLAEARKWITGGLGSFILLWLWIWILMFTLFL